MRSPRSQELSHSIEAGRSVAGLGGWDGGGWERADG